MKESMSATRELATAFSNWQSTILALMVQYLSRSAKAGKFSTLWMLAEPLIYILVFYLIRIVVRGRLGEYGTSPFLFLVSGMYPYFVFVRTSVLSRAVVKSGRTIPRVQSLDGAIAEVCANALIWLTIITLLFLGMWAYGIEQAKPDSISTCATALAALLLFGLGVGLLNAAIARFFAFWTTIYGIMTRGLIFFSGVFHVADLYPLWLREWLAWNPLLHGIIWFRIGVYGRYPDYIFDPSYLVKCAVIALFIGLVADRVTLRHGGR